MHLHAQHFFNNQRKTMAAKTTVQNRRAHPKVPIQFRVEPELRQSFTDVCKKHQKLGTDVLRSLLVQWISEMDSVIDLTGPAAVQAVISEAAVGGKKK